MAIAFKLFETTLLNFPL